MRDLAIDSLQNSVRLSPDSHLSHHIFRLKRIDGSEDIVPTLVPPCHNFPSCGGRPDFELAIAEAVGLLAVRGQKLSEAGAHVSCQMLHENSDRISFAIQGDEEIFIAKLVHCALAHALVAPQLPADFLEIMLADIHRHKSP